MIKISVIVPIYNTEEYLYECIDSIINQSLHDIEIILVNDGSTDRSAQICAEYAKVDERIKVINKTNGGLISARKAGINVATGDYVTYVDSDDFIETDTLEKMYGWVIKSQPDVIACAFTEDYGTRLNIKKNALENGMYKGEKLEALYGRLMDYGEFYTPAIWPSLCLKLYKRKLLTKYQLQIPDDITMGEDAGVTFPILFNCDCIVVDNDIAGYHYRVVDDSMTRRSSLAPRYFEQISNLYEYMRKEFSKKENINIDSQLQNYRLFLVYMGMKRLKALSYRRRERINYVENKIRGTAIFNDIERSDLSSYPDKTYLVLTARGEYLLADTLEILKVIRDFTLRVLWRLKRLLLGRRNVNGGD